MDINHSYYEDVLNKEIFISGTSQACAHGSAILGAVNENAYSSLLEASEKMKKPSRISYKPNTENVIAYSKLYKEYKTLCNFFANSGNKTMEVLKSISGK